MSPRTEITGATVLHLDPPRVERDIDVIIESGTITAVGPGLAGEHAEDLRGAWLIPGLVCAHTHLYSALSCGMPMPADTPESFTAMLEQVWWKLDRALDLDAVGVSARVGAIAALRSGVTTLIDHHASPSAIRGSLEALDAGLGEAGVRRVLCYEVSDRGGEEEARAGLEAHAALLGQDGAGMRAMLIGGHANFTLSDATLRRMGAMARQAGVGVHVHVAEARDDAASVGEDLVARMRRLDALPPMSVLAHCVHLSRDQLQAVHDAGAWITHQPRSNMNNQVGYAPTGTFGPHTALGTDGIGADMLSEAQAAWYALRQGGVAAGPDLPMRWLTGGARLAGALLNRRLGCIAPGYAADLVVLDAAPGPRLSADNLAAAIIFRMSAAQVRHVMVNGDWALRDRMPTGLDAAEVDRVAQSTAARVWARM